MKYNRKPISSILRSNKTVFTFKDIALMWADSNKKATIAAVHYYVKTGELYHIRRGIYAKNKDYDRLELATRIFTPSYVSFETVLVKAGINFQFYEKIMVASYQTRTLVVDGQTYSYKKIKNFVLTNPLGVEHKHESSIASPERAFLDTLYIHKEYYFDNLGPLDWNKVFEILPIYNNKRMTQKVKTLFEHYKSTQ
jgi:hypothetical protein